MAEKAFSATFAQVMEDMRAGKFAPVYLLVGEEPYYIDKVTDYIAENVLREEERDFNQLVLYGLDTNPVQVMDAAHAAPMMAEHQVVIVREAQLMKDIDKLEKYFKSPVKSTILVICYKKEYKPTKKGWAAEVEKCGVILNSPKLKENAIPDFVTTYLKEKGATIDNKALAMVADHIGPDLSRLAGELDKLLIPLSDNNRHIVPEFVEEQIGISKDFNPYELRDALVRKDVMKANRIVKYFDKNPKAGNVHSLTPMLFNYFQNLMLAHYCPKKTNGWELASWLGLKGEWAARDYVSGVRTFNAMKTMQILTMLRTTLAKSNGLGNKSATDGDLLQELIYFILH